jgi:hypothetical protein
MCPESETITGNLESNAYGSVHSLSDGPTGNAPTKLIELGWTLGDLPSAFACRASTEPSSVTYTAAVSKALQTYQCHLWGIPYTRQSPRQDPASISDQSHCKVTITKSL